MFGLILLISYFSHAQQKDSIAGPVIKTLSGDVRGVTIGSVASFKGIPYATPPVGEWRWRPPQPVKAWKDVRDARKFCSDCAQVGFPRSDADSISKSFQYKVSSRKINAIISLPQKVTGRFVWDGKSYSFKPGKNTISL